jgi:hypothetical protein
MSEDTDMNAQVNPGVATSEVTGNTVPQVETNDLAQGGSGMTPPGFSPGGDSQEDGSASSDISDVVYDEHGNELVDLNHSPELLKKRAGKRARRVAKAARRASKLQASQREPVLGSSSEPKEKAPYFKVASRLDSYELARVMELRKSFHDQSSITGASTPPFQTVDSFIEKMQSRNPSVYNFTKLSDDFVITRPDDLVPLMRASDTLLRLWTP